MVIDQRRKTWSWAKKVKGFLGKMGFVLGLKGRIKFRQMVEGNGKKGKKMYLPVLWVLTREK